MKKTKLLLLIYIIVSPFLYAQSEDDDMDAIANDPHSVSTAANAARESLWSLSSYDMDWKMPQYSNTNGWQAVSVPHRDINLSVSGSEQTNNTTTQKRKGQTIFEQNAASHAAQTNRAVAGMKRVQAMREAAARRAAEERRRKAEEDRRDYEVGYANHKSATASFYQTKAAEDAWLHSEGVRLLENANSLDRANVPNTPATHNVKTKSGSQLAGMLKQQQGGDVEVVIITSSDEGRKSSVSFEGTKSNIDMFDNMRINVDDETAWVNELTGSTPKITFSDNKCFNVNKEILIKGQNIDFDLFNITTIPFSGCVSLIGDSVFVLDNKNSRTAESLPSFGVSQMVICGNRILGKKDNQVVEIIGNKIKPVCSFDNELFLLHPDTDTTILVHSNLTWISVILQLNIEKLTYNELARTELEVRKVSSNGNIIVVLVDDFVMRINNGLQLLYCSLVHINDICMSRDGLLIATDKNLILLNDSTEACVFASSGASKVWSDIEDIYALSKDNNMIKYH